MLLMVLCCLIPLALIAAVSIFGFSLGALSGLLPYAIALMCPLMMIFMMRGMGHEHDDEHAHHHSDAPRVANPRQGALPASNAPKAASSKQESCH
jgi:hypothetical protein